MILICLLIQTRAPGSSIQLLYRLSLLWSARIPTDFRRSILGRVPIFVVSDLGEVPGESPCYNVSTIIYASIQCHALP